MSKQNLFSHLTKEDRQKILDLCETKPYHSVVEELSKPRAEGGLEIVTSTSALCRFYTNHQKDCADLEILSQYGKSLQIRREQNQAASLTGILALVESRLLHSLKQGRAVSDLTEEFRTLSRVHKAFVSEQKMREANPNNSEANYRAYVHEQATSPDVDFLDNTPGIDRSEASCAEEEFQSGSREAVDIEKEKDRLERQEYEQFVREEEQRRQAHARQVAQAKTKAAEVAARRPMRAPGTSDAQWNQILCAWEAAKIPQIPPFPPLTEAQRRYAQRNRLIQEAFPQTRELFAKQPKLLAA